MKYEIMRRRRQALGWTQAELAEKANMSAGTVSSYERGLTISPVYENAITTALNKVWDEMSYDERHRLKIMEVAIQISEASTEKYLLRSLTYLVRECSLYMNDILKQTEEI